MSGVATRGRRRLGRAVLVAGALAAAACSSSNGDAEGPAATSSTTGDRTTTTTIPTTGPESSTSAPKSTVDPIEWSSCGGDECATVTVPLDHDDPDGPTIDLAVLRRPASGERIGALFFNFGGPGSGATSILRTFSVPGDVRERFDLVAVDPRGVGDSTPLDCGLDPQTLYSVDHTIEDAIDIDTLVDVSERYARDCEERRGDLLPHVGTRDVARDHDLVRAAMGDETLNFIGFSYGTSIGQTYADLFPERVRTMVLDGVLDPAAGGIELAREQAQGFETALQDWADDCDFRSSCGFADPIGTVERVLADAEEGIPSCCGVRTLGPGEAAVALAFPLYAESLWPSLDEAVADAAEGDAAAMVALAERYERLVDFAAYFAVSRLDATWPTDARDVIAFAEEAGAESPRFGEAIVNDYLRCAVWPVPPDPLGPITATGAPPILVVSTTGDPATPYQNGVDVAERLESGVLLTNEGNDHTIVFQGSPCVDRVVIDYLIDRVSPPDGDRC